MTKIKLANKKCSWYMTIMSNPVAIDFDDAASVEKNLKSIILEDIDKSDLSHTIPLSHDIIHRVVGLSGALGDTTDIYSDFAEIVVEAIENYLYALLVGGSNPSLFTYIQEKLALNAFESVYETCADPEIIHMRVAPYIEIITAHIAIKIDKQGTQSNKMSFTSFEEIIEQSLWHLTISNITPQASETKPPALAKPCRE